MLMSASVRVELAGVTKHVAVQVVVEVMEPGKLVLYPHLLLACTALLGMTYVHLWRLLLDLLSKVRLTVC